MTSILLYVTSTREVVILEVEDKLDRDLIEQNGREFERWPWDLGAYDLKPGLYMWTGTVPEIEDVEWKGSFRTVIEAPELE